MPYKCCVYNCKSNYDTTLEKVTAFRFPECNTERQRWISSLPNDQFKYTKSLRICVKHWPEDFPFRTVRGGSKVPLKPPSIFDVPASCIPLVTQARLFTNPSSVQNQLPDQLEEFCKRDKLGSIDDIAQFFESEFKSFDFSVISASGKLILVSNEYCGAVAKFTVFVTASDGAAGPGIFEVKLYMGIERIFVPFLKKNITLWSELENGVRYILNYDREGETSSSKRSSFITRQIELLNKPIGVPYTISDLTVAMNISSRSRSAYSEIRKYLALPSLRLLRSITSQVDKVSDLDFLTKMFKGLEKKQKWCMIILDEVYVNVGYQYSGGAVYGKSLHENL